MIRFRNSTVEGSSKSSDLVRGCANKRRKNEANKRGYPPKQAQAVQQIRYVRRPLEKLSSFLSCRGCALTVHGNLDNIRVQLARPFVLHRVSLTHWPSKLVQQEGKDDLAPAPLGRPLVERPCGSDAIIVIHPAPCFEGLPAWPEHRSCREQVATPPNTRAQRH